MLSCGRCACRFAGRLADPKELEELYGGYYAEADPVLPEFLRRRMAEIAAGFAPYRKTGKLLDVGYGAGALLTAAQEAGWECWGTELSPVVIEAGTRRGWTVYQGDLLEAGLPDGAFDVVCMVELLEHLEDPTTYIRKCRELLRPGGLLYATTPNGLSLNSRVLGLDWSVCHPPEHMQLFTAGAMARAVKAAGFRSWTIRTEGLNPSELSRRLRRSGQEAATASRVESGYALNERLSSGSGPRLVKRLANGLLSATGTGDTLKVFAVNA
jgi:SAM-dependent methyltransferase